jgi:hypothetical protein
MKFDQVKALAKQYNISPVKAMVFLRQKVDPANADQYVGVKIAARILMTTPPTLYKRIRNGEIASAKINGVIMIKVRDILQAAQADQV